MRRFEGPRYPHALERPVVDLGDRAAMGVVPVDSRDPRQPGSGLRVGQSFQKSLGALCTRDLGRVGGARHETGPAECPIAGRREGERFGPAERGPQAQQQAEEPPLARRRRDGARFDLPQPSGEIRIPRHGEPTETRGEGLVPLRREERRVRDRPVLPSPIRPAEAVGAVLDERQTSAHGDRSELVDGRGEPEGVLREDRTRFRRDAHLELREVDVERHGLDLEVHRTRSGVEDRVRNDDASERRDQDLSVGDSQRLEDRGEGDAPLPEERDVLRRQLEVGRDRLPIGRNVVPTHRFSVLRRQAGGHAARPSALLVYPFASMSHDSATAANLLDGAALARTIRAEVAAEARAIAAAGRVPRLVVFLVGDDEASRSLRRSEDEGRGRNRTARRDGAPPEDDAPGGAPRAHRRGQPRPRRGRHPGPAAPAPRTRHAARPRRHRSRQGRRRLSPRERRPPPSGPPALHAVHSRGDSGAARRERDPARGPPGGRARAKRHRRQSPWPLF